MSIPYESRGRAAQKARTRATLVEAARELLRIGKMPTVEEVADAASISRPTAYRYFANQKALLVAIQPNVAHASLLGASPPADLERRLHKVAVSITQMVLDEEPALRAMLRLALSDGSPRPTDLPLRRGRRIAWIEDALEPLRGTLNARDFRRLVLAIGMTLGIEALVWLTDVAGLSHDEAVETMRWSARKLLNSML